MENFPQERISERTQIFDVPVPQTAKESVEAVRVVLRDRMQQRTVCAPTPQVLEETVGRLVLHERVQLRTAEQTEDAPQYPEETVEMVRSVSHDRAGGMSEQHQLVLLGVFFRRWAWTNATIAMARLRRKRG